MNKYWLVAMAIAAAVALPATGADKQLPPASDQKGVTYDKDIKPLFEASCVKCHGPEKQKGKVRLDSLEASLKSAGGKAVVPGKSAESELVISVAQLSKDPDHNMPPADKGKPLSKEQVGLIRAWIDQGAK